MTSGPELAAHLAVAPDPLVRVLDHLVTAGFLRRDQDGACALTDAGQWLRDDHPQGIRAWIDLEGAIGHADLSVVELLHTVRTGEPAFPRHFGRGFWEDLAEHPGRAASFDAMMGRQRTAAASVAAAYDWSALGEVVDVGGGDGSLLITLLRAHPTLREPCSTSHRRRPPPPGPWRRPVSPIAAVPRRGASSSHCRPARGLHSLEGHPRLGR